MSDNIIQVMMDPTSNPAATPPPPPPAPEPAPAPAAQAPAESAPAPAAPAPDAPISQAEKKRVIVDEFDYSTVKTSIQAVFNTQADIGKGIRAMMVKRLADANKVVVVERAKVDQLMAEQDRNASNRVKQGSGARVGRISGARRAAGRRHHRIRARRQEDRYRRRRPAAARFRRHSLQEGRGQGRGRDHLPADRRRDVRSHRHWRSARRIGAQEQRTGGHGRRVRQRRRRRRAST